LRFVAAQWKIKIYEMEVMTNHIHIFVEIPPTMTVSFALQILKGGSARIFFKRCTIWREVFLRNGWKLHLWSPGKFFRSVGCVTAEVVENYIKNSNNWEFEFLKKNQTVLSAY
jgi:putative transposase